MKLSYLVALAVVTVASTAQAQQNWTGGGWKTIAAYDAETALLERALATAANYDSDVAQRLCFNRIFALQEHILDDAHREYAYFASACQASPDHVGRCTNFAARDPSCTNHDISVLWDTTTNAVRVLRAKVSELFGGRGTPPSLIPTTRPPSSPEATPTVPTTVIATEPPPATTAAVGPATAPPTPTPTTPPTPTPAKTVLTVANTTADERTEPIVETERPSALPTTPTPAPTTVATKSLASSSLVSGVAMTVAVVAGAMLNLL